MAEKLVLEPPIDTINVEYTGESASEIEWEVDDVESGVMSKAEVMPVCHLSDWINNLPHEPSPFSHFLRFRQDDEIVLAQIVQLVSEYRPKLKGYLRAGPRQLCVWKKDEVVPAIVTCGGLCPGLNAVIRAIARTLMVSYNVKDVWGVPYGYEGIRSETPFRPLTMAEIDTIHELGGTILGTARGGCEADRIVDVLVERGTLADEAACVWHCY